MTFLRGPPGCFLSDRKWWRSTDEISSSPINVVKKQKKPNTKNKTGPTHPSGWIVTKRNLYCPFSWEVFIRIPLLTPSVSCPVSYNHRACEVAIKLCNVLEQPWLGQSWQPGWSCLGFLFSHPNENISGREGSEQHHVQKGNDWINQAPAAAILPTL